MATVELARSGEQGPILVDKYPLAIGANPDKAKKYVTRKVNSFISDEIFNGIDRDEVRTGIFTHLRFAEREFVREEEARKRNLPGADLYYHGRPHFFQAIYDTIAILEALARHNKQISKLLTARVCIAAIVASTYHDIGYVHQLKPGRSAAKRRPIHVELSKYVASRNVLDSNTFESFDREMLSSYIYIAIHGTHFPYKEEKAQEAERLISQLPESAQEEARLTLKVVRLADLGGQTARPDQFNVGLKMLRREMNHEEKGKGTAEIGTDLRINERRYGFVRGVVIPTVGEIAAELFGSHDNPYERAWTRGMR